MALSPGTKLGPYEIVEPIGAGGMGEVYRARDTRLERTVAIKVLPQHLSSDPELKRRFEREAKAISSLQHPHICTLHDVGTQDGVDFLVMEHLEGETLAARLLRGALPTEQVLKIGMQIANALDKAHRQGVVHRDLKPGNIMLTKSGAKLMDFGLAKPAAPGAGESASSEAVTSPSLGSPSAPLTDKGVVVGTFQYMSPEQVEGKEADARSDIFALGAVLYEMATGKRAFEGKSRLSVASAILEKEPPPISSIQPLVPVALEHVVHVCLAKDPEDRWQSAADVARELTWIREGGSQAGMARVVAKRRWTRELTAWWAAALFLTTTALISVAYWRRLAAAAPPIMFTVEAAPGYTLPEDGPSALSPDGRMLAYAAGAKGQESLWVRSLDSLASKRLEGSESSTSYLGFVWTLDGKGVIAQTNGKLVRFSVTGGANEVLCEKFEGAPSAINGDGMVLAWFAPPTKIVSVSPEHCTPREVSPAVGQDSQVAYAFPHFLPDGNHFLFAAIHQDKHHEVLVGSLDGAKPQVVVRNGSFPKYLASGYVLFERDGYLMAQKFDAESLRSSGEPFLVYGNQLSFYAAFGWAAFDASRSGVISGHEQTVLPSQLRWYGRSGQLLETIGEPEYRESLRLSGQGTQVAVSLWEPRTHAVDVWSLDLQRETRRRETFRERAGTGWPVWSPDGKQMVYSALVNGHPEMFLKEPGTSGNGEMIQTGLAGGKLCGSFSPDGSSIAYLVEGSANEGFRIYGQSLVGGKPFLVAHAGPDEEEVPRISPDGRWVAYVSGESGTSEVLVRPFTAEAAASIQVSTGGGHQPRWSQDGKELFYFANDRQLTAVPYKNGPQLQFGKPILLFRLAEGAAEYDTVDGKRFLVNETAGGGHAPLFVIVNWRPEPAKSM